MTGKNAASKEGDLKGIYRRGKIFWLNATVEGKRHFASLGTADITDAVRRKKEILNRASLEVAQGAVLDLEIDRYVAWKSGPLADRSWSRMTQAAQPPRLEAFARFVGNKKVEQITPAVVRRYYAQCRKLSP